MPAASPADTVGQCFTCRWMRSTTTRHGSTFFRCARADTDARFARYPTLPMRGCPGYEVAMLFVVLMHYTQPLDAVNAVRVEHVRHLESYAARGLIHAWARRDPPTGGLFIATAPDRVTLEAVVAEDPYIRAGVATAEIVEVPSRNVRGALRT